MGKRTKPAAEAKEPALIDEPHYPWLQTPIKMSSLDCRQWEQQLIPRKTLPYPIKTTKTTVLDLPYHQPLSDETTTQKASCGKKSRFKSKNPSVRLGHTKDALHMHDRELAFGVPDLTYTVSDGCVGYDNGEEVAMVTLSIQEMLAVERYAHSYPSAQVVRPEGGKKRTKRSRK
ncbi:MAG: hypothetical protein KKD39_04620 [Candidatus Altiarchaeota archaeon]|nr:hypothetical protein [Candidatus Altiarchaeota archaeon]